MKITKLLNFFDCLILVGLCTMLITAFGYQFTVHDLPCALCVMVRMGLYAMAFGLVNNIQHGRCQTNYLMVILAAVIDLIISIEFVVRHIVPGSGSYGSAVFGLHMYTWNLLVVMLIIIYAAIAGLLIGTYPDSQIGQNKKVLAKVIIGLLLVTLAANLISTAIECGPFSCPSDPHSYWLIDKLTSI